MDILEKYNIHKSNIWNKVKYNTRKEKKGKIIIVDKLYSVKKAFNNKDIKQQIKYNNRKYNVYENPTKLMMRWASSIKNDDKVICKFSIFPIYNTELLKYFDLPHVINAKSTKYTLIKHIGTGSEGCVFLTDNYMCVKIYKKQFNRFNFLQEYQNYEFVNKIIDSFVFNDQLMSITRYLGNTLYDYIGSDVKLTKCVLKQIDKKYKINLIEQYKTIISHKKFDVENGNIVLYIYNNIYTLILIDV